MNNKGLIILLVLVVFLVTGCKETHNKAIDIAYQLTATAPDSALSVLDGVNQAKLSKAEMARYALVYTIAQDKSGLDVDNDSLLRTAYTYFNNREEAEPMLINYEPWLDSFESRFCLLNKFSYEIFCFLFLSMYVHFANKSSNRHTEHTTLERCNCKWSIYTTSSRPLQLHSYVETA